jgi:signal transduction histidine kinase
MDEIVWAVNPGNDTLEHLADYLLHFAQEFFCQSTICCRLEIPAELPEVRLSTEVRHHVFLAVKEALNNVARHSGARNVQIRLMIEPGTLILGIEDDGVGFDPDSVRPGCDGLSNMRQRLVLTGGVLEVSSASGRGTVLTLRIPLRRGAWAWSRSQRGRPGPGA